ncbi:MAG: hypothetical protein L6262_04680 [Weeksellaceae bacterium]|nr:hypothetical protein [Weeksellaceae bacterium]
MEIIGEAVNKITKKNIYYLEKISESTAIIALRNHVIPAYDSVSDEKYLVCGH